MQRMTQSGESIQSVELERKRIRGREKQNKEMLIKDFPLNVERFYIYTWEQKVVGKEVMALVNELLNVQAIELFYKRPKKNNKKILRSIL